MCVGCRQSVEKSELLRVVVCENTLTVDPQHKLSGRGAYVHLAQDCVAAAKRRGSWQRALRVRGSVDDSVVKAFVATVTGD